MTAPLKLYRKAAVERRRLYIDYSCWLAAIEKLTDFQVTTSPYTAAAPITIDTTYPDIEQKQLMMFIGGGVANTSYSLDLVVRTDAGQVKRDTIGIRVTP
jgi:hypothetical protein